ncbi:MAG: diaminopimelate decarboxylase [Alphaproteobacteria bacterium]|nr:diaminopimelate decarboxylase [Alphaproteobacteria bacterium]
MTGFAYRGGAMMAEDVALARIAAEVGTPAYCYSQTAIEDRYREFTAALSGVAELICFAVKANSNLAVIRTLADLGAGADVVSEGELRRALAAGVPPRRIVFSGVGKSAAEMSFALKAGIRQINVESIPELEALNEVAQAAGRSAEIAIRVNPNVDARTHEKITTGLRENKFGIDFADVAAAAERAAALPAIELVGLAVHIGSQLTELAPYEAAFTTLAELVRELRDGGHDIHHLDLGGGLGVDYAGEAPPAFDDYAAIVRRTVGDLGCALAFEPGRVLVAEAGVLLARVLVVKQGGSRTFVIVDAAMNDLVRPSMYDAYHAIDTVDDPGGATRAEADVVGPVCESGDRLGLARLLPPLRAGDLIVVRNAGAYGAVMSSTYNSRPLVPEVMVRGDAYAVVRPRQSYDAMLAQDFLPKWQQEPAATMRKATG